jgi:hypothetical protein
MNLQMVDLKGQYEKLKPEIDQAIQQVIDTTAFINGPQVKEFSTSLANYLGAKHVITCANGTDALQIALMVLGLQPGDEVIVPCFTYVATVEVIALLKLKPVITEVDPDTFNITAEIIEKAITSKTKAIVPVHLFGQSADMEPIYMWSKTQLRQLAPTIHLAISWLKRLEPLEILAVLLSFLPKIWDVTEMEGRFTLTMMNWPRSSGKLPIMVRLKNTTTK